MQYKEADLKHIPQMHTVRMAVRQNVLSHPHRITQNDYETYLTTKGKGWVCEADDVVVGFSVVNLAHNNVWALFVMPGYEGKGIGKSLQQLMLQWYFSQTTETIWLSTEHGTRAAEFYSRTGWKACGWYNNLEIKFELCFDDWFRMQV